MNQGFGFSAMLSGSWMCLHSFISKVFLPWGYLLIHYHKLHRNEVRSLVSFTEEISWNLIVICEPNI